LQSALELGAGIGTTPLSRFAVLVLEPAQAQTGVLTLPGRRRCAPRGQQTLRQKEAALVAIEGDAHFVEMSFRNLWAASMSLIDLSAMARYTIWFLTTRAK